MKRIATANRAVDLFAANKDGFRAAVPGVSDATYLSALWFNHMQEAIVRMIERANLPLSDVDFDQFGTALDALYAVKPGAAIIGATVLTPKDVAKTFTVFGTTPQTITLPKKEMLDTGWAVTINSVNNAAAVTIAAQGADLIDGVDPGGARPSITIGYGESVTIVAGPGNSPKFQAIGANQSTMKFAPMFGASLAPSGFQKLPSGYIEQWGQVAVGAAGDTPITFPTNFPNQFLIGFVSGLNTGTGAWGGYNSPTLSGMNVNWWSSSSTRIGGTVNYRVIGK